MAPQVKTNNNSLLRFKNLDEWRKWLSKNYDDQTGVWLKIAKKSSGKSSVSQQEALDVALCYGWIDGQRKSFDTQYFLQKYTPRRKGSLWSKINVAKVEKLVAEGKMQKSGLAEVEKAKQDGRWAAAYDSAKTISTPKDFQVALNKNLKAKAFYETLNKTNTYAFCWRIQTAKKPQTRKARIEKIILMLEHGEKIH